MGRLYGVGGQLGLHNDFEMNLSQKTKQNFKRKQEQKANSSCVAKVLQMQSGIWSMLAKGSVLLL